MPTLPTLDVTQTQADRIIQAYAPGGTQAQAVAAYREWLRKSIVEHVQKVELAALRQTNRQEEAQLAQQIANTLPPEPPPTDPIPG